MQVWSELIGPLCFALNGSTHKKQPQLQRGFIISSFLLFPIVQHSVAPLQATKCLLLNRRLLCLIIHSLGIHVSMEKILSANVNDVEYVCPPPEMHCLNVITWFTHACTAQGKAPTAPPRPATTATQANIIKGKLMPETG